MGESLTELDLSGSHVSDVHFEVLLANVRAIQVLRLEKCQKLDGACVSLIAQTCHRTLRELYIKDCGLFRVDVKSYLASYIYIYIHINYVVKFRKIIYSALYLFFYRTAYLMDVWRYRDECPTAK